MVHWFWLIVAAMVGGGIGAFAMGLCAFGAANERQVDYFVENQRLRDENWYLKRKLDGTE